jgi:hypothetical protein
LRATQWLGWRTPAIPGLIRASVLRSIRRRCGLRLAGHNDAGSAPREPPRPLLGERAHAFAGVLAARQRMLHLREPGHRRGRALLDRLQPVQAGRDHRQRRLRRDRLRAAQRLLQLRAGRHHLLQEVQPQRLGAAQAVARQQVQQRIARPARSAMGKVAPPVAMIPRLSSSCEKRQSQPTVTPGAAQGNGDTPTGNSASPSSSV